jgi:hypothetical protein
MPPTDGDGDGEGDGDGDARVAAGLGGELRVGAGGAVLLQAVPSNHQIVRNRVSGRDMHKEGGPETSRFGQVYGVRSNLPGEPS